MSALDRPPRVEATLEGRPPGVVRDLIVGALPLLLLVLATWWPLRLPATYIVHSVVLYLLLCGLILRGIPAASPGPGLGAANRVTLLRAALILPLSSLVLHADALSASGYWWVVGVATVALILDGVDGRLARQMGSATGFGARFDMEMDAFLLLVLSLLVWLSGQTGPWVILIGALRYLFVGASWVWPALREELPPSRRRQAVCVGQGVILVACIAPVVPPALAAMLATTALALLVYSFGVDVRWLLESEPEPENAAM